MFHSVSFRRIRFFRKPCFSFQFLCLDLLQPCLITRFVTPNPRPIFILISKPSDFSLPRRALRDNRFLAVETLYLDADILLPFINHIDQVHRVDSLLCALSNLRTNKTTEISTASTGHMRHCYRSYRNRGGGEKFFALSNYPIHQRLTSPAGFCNNLLRLFNLFLF